VWKKIEMLIVFVVFFCVGWLFNGEQNALKKFEQSQQQLEQVKAEAKANAGLWVELESLSGEYRLVNHFTQGFVQEITAKGEFGRKIAVHNWHGKIPEHFAVKDGKIIECK